MANSIKEPTTVDLTSGFFLNKFYTTNRKACASGTRKDFENCELVYEDSKALKKASRYVTGFTYSKDDNKSNVYNSIIAFTETYNNAVSSSSKIDDRETSRYAKQLKNLVSQNEDALKEAGITINDDGTLKVHETQLKNKDLDKLKKAFSQDSALMKKTSSLARRMNTAANEYIYSQITGNGLRINISL